MYEFAYTYPYSYSQLQRWLLSWQRLRLPYLQRHLLCRTPHVKRVDVLVIQDTSIDVGQSYTALRSQPPINHRTPCLRSIYTVRSPDDVGPALP